MDAVDQVPVLVLHILETDIPQDSGVIKQHIDATEILDRSFNDTLAILNTVVVGDRLTTGGPDLIDDDIGSLGDVS